MFRLYFVSDRRLTPDESPVGPLLAAVTAGADMVQIREKDLPDSELLAMARRVVAGAEGAATEVYVNARFDIALSAGADGVHLPAAGLSPAVVRRAAGRLKIGVSTHSLEEALRAEDGGADFISFGPVFDTPSKRRYGAPQGVAALRALAGRVSLPVYAIGGINSGNVSRLRGSGITGVAVISAFAESKERPRMVSVLRDMNGGAEGASR